MTSRDFVYWLQGYFEIHEKTPRPPEPHSIDGLNDSQVACIKAHLAMVFIHEIDPSFPKEQQATLDAAHAPSTPDLEVKNPPSLTADPNKRPPRIGGGPGPGGTVYRC